MLATLSVREFPHYNARFQAVTFNLLIFIAFAPTLARRVRINSDGWATLFSNQPREYTMLVLTRKQQEKIQIGNGITITVLKLKGKSVRLGIEAPTEVPVVRGELLFDNDRQISQDDAADGEVSAAAPPLPTKAARVRESNWTSEANTVLQRVSRSEVDKLRGPLRTMLERRTVS